jgi:hypothetical protein
LSVFFVRFFVRRSLHKEDRAGAVAPGNSEGLCSVCLSQVDGVLPLVTATYLMNCVLLEERVRFWHRR